MDAEAARVRVDVLGPVAVVAADARASAVGGATARALVAALVLADGAPRGVDALVDDVWGDDRPRNPRAALQTLVSRVRAACADELVRSTPAGYVLGDVDTDLRLARDALAAATRSADGHRAAASHPVPPADPVAVADAALALWRGEPGADLPPVPVADALAEAAASLRQRLEGARAGALHAAGRYDDEAAALQRLATAHPYDEDLHARLMAALSAAGRSAQALAVFAALRDRLRADLGADPSPALVDANARLLRASPARRVRIGLRSALTPLIGRDDDIARVASLLRTSRLVTILGTGGLGKTRLAQAVAAASDAHAVIVVPLAGVRSDDAVATAIAAALGISEATPGGSLTDVAARPDLRTRVLSLLGEQPALVVLDNCEQVVDGVAVWASDLLGSVPSLRLLTTSRTPLSIAAESVYPLAPLAVVASAAEAPGAASAPLDQPATRLFAERARAARPGVVLPADAVVRLSARLDGLPLAIELAAARVRTMTVTQIEERLRDRFALLTTGDRSAPERHRTLEAVIGWSWDLLAAAPRAALAVLSLLPGGFDAETAAAVIGPDADDVVDGLVSQSLLTVSEEPPTGVRFRMLESVREFGLARLDDAEAGGPEVAWDRVRGWARAFAGARLRTAFEAPTYAQIRAEHDNLVSVLHRVVADSEQSRADGRSQARADADIVILFAALAPSWMIRGGFSELEAFVPVAVAAASRIDERDAPADALLFTLALGVLVGVMTGGAHPVRQAARLRGIRRRARGVDPVLAAFADLVLAVPGAALERRINELRSDRDAALRVLGEMMLANWAENEGRPEVGLEAAVRAWTLAAQAGDDWVQAMAASSAAGLSSQLGRPRDALEWLERAEEASAVFDADARGHQQEWMRGVNLLALGEREKAGEIFTALASGPRSMQIGDGADAVAAGLLGLAEMHRLDGDRPAAASGFAQALDAFGPRRSHASPWYLMAAAVAVAAVAMDASAPPETAASWARQLRLHTLVQQRMSRGAADRPRLGTALAGWGTWAVTAGAPGSALQARGLAAVALAARLGARQDMLSLRADGLRAQAQAVAGPAAVAEAEAAAAAVPDDRLVARAVAVLTGSGLAAAGASAAGPPPRT